MSSNQQFSDHWLRITKDDLTLLEQFRDMDTQEANTPESSAHALKTAHDLAVRLLGYPKMDPAPLQSRLREVEQELQSVRQTPAPTIVLPPTQPYAPPPIRDPEVFDGDRTKYRACRAHLKLKMDADSHRFPDEVSKLRYTIGLLLGQAFAQIEPYIMDNGIDLSNVKHLMDILDILFGDPNRKITAQAAMRNLRQKNSSFPAYYADFKRISQDLAWNDEALMDALYEGLSEEMKDKLSNFMEQPNTLQGYIELCYKADGLLRRRENDKKSHNTPKAPARTTAPTTYVPDTRITEPMDLSSGRKKLTSEERLK